ncbi:MAG: hypothetical protein AAGM38_04835 [Pseudomonadota bacterium]
MKIRFPIKSLTCAAAIAVAGGANADPSVSYQETGQSAFAEIVLAGHDSNRDRALDFAEFKAAARGAPNVEGEFAALDVNGDALLDAGELSAWQDQTIDRLEREYKAAQ